MHVGRHTTAQSAEIHSFGVHLSTWLTVGKQRARMSRRKAPEKLDGAAHGHAQEPTPGSVVEFWGKRVSKKRPLVPRSDIACSWARRGEGTLGDALPYSGPPCTVRATLVWLGSRLLPARVPCS